MDFFNQVMGGAEDIGAGQVSRNEISRLNNALRKAATIGYQTPAGTSVAGGAADAGSYAPLVAQSIANTGASLSFTNEDLTLWKRAPRGKATQPLHEYTVQVAQGADMPIFFDEGGVTGTNVTLDSRESVRVKYLAEKREVTDVATTVGLLGVNKQALARETAMGTIKLLERTERAMFHGDSTINPKGFDGILKQVRDRAPGNVFDLEGSAPTMDMLSEMAHQFGADGGYARVDTIYVEPRIKGELIRQQTAAGRFQNTSITNGTQLTVGIQDIGVMGPYGRIPIVSAPFMNSLSYVPMLADKSAIRNVGVGDTAFRPTLPAQAVAIAAGANANSKFVAADAGFYRYYVEAVGDKGLSAVWDVGNVTVAAGDRVTFSIDAAAAVAGGAAAPIYYRIYRTLKNGTFSGATKIKDVAFAAGVDTDVTDDNVTKPGSSSILAIQHIPEVFEWVQLLDLVRRPLAEVATSKPFMIMQFGTVVVKAPTKCWMLDNCTANSTI